MTAPYALKLSNSSLYWRALGADETSADALVGVNFEARFIAEGAPGYPAVDVSDFGVITDPAYDDSGWPLLPQPYYNSTYGSRPDGTEVPDGGSGGPVGSSRWMARYHVDLPDYDMPEGYPADPFHLAPYDTSSPADLKPYVVLFFSDNSGDIFVDGELVIEGNTADYGGGDYSSTYFIAMSPGSHVISAYKSGDDVYDYLAMYVYKAKVPALDFRVTGPSGGVVQIDALVTGLVKPFYRFVSDSSKRRIDYEWRWPGTSVIDQFTGWDGAGRVDIQGTFGWSSSDHSVGLWAELDGLWVLNTVQPLLRSTAGWTVGRIAMGGTAVLDSSLSPKFAVTYKGTSDAGGSNPLTFTPNGDMEVGDRCLLAVTARDTSGAWATPAGWTELYQGQVESFTHAVYTGLLADLTTPIEALWTGAAVELGGAMVAYGPGTAVSEAGAPLDFSALGGDHPRVPSMADPPADHETIVTIITAMMTGANYAHEVDPPEGWAGRVLISTTGEVVHTIADYMLPVPSWMGDVPIYFQPLADSADWLCSAWLLAGYG